MRRNARRRWPCLVCRRLWSARSTRACASSSARHGNDAHRHHHQGGGQAAGRLRAHDPAHAGRRRAGRGKNTGRDARFICQPRESMPYKKSDSPYWYASYVDARGKRIRRSTGTTDRREAAALEGKWRAEVHQQKKWGASPRYTFEELISKYLAATTSKKSTERDAYAIQALRPYFAGLAIADITGE